MPFRLCAYPRESHHRKAIQKIVNTRASRREVERLMKEWTILRRSEEDRRRRIADSNRDMLHRWQPEDSHSVEERELVHEQVAIAVSMLKESTELGRLNNENFAQCVVDFGRAKKMRGDAKLQALEKLEREITHVISIDFPHRVSVLDNFEDEGRRLDVLIGQQLESRT